IQLLNQRPLSLQGSLVALSREPGWAGDHDARRPGPGGEDGQEAVPVLLPVLLKLLPEHFLLLGRPSQGCQLFVHLANVLDVLLLSLPSPDLRNHAVPAVGSHGPVEWDVVWRNRNGEVGGTRWLLRLLLRRLDRRRLRFRGARLRLHCRCTWSRWLWRRDRPLLWGRRTRFLDCRHGGLCRRQGRGLGGRLGRWLRWSRARTSSHLLRPRWRHVLGCRAGRGPLPRLLHPLAHLGRHLLRQARIDPAGLRVCLVDGCPVVRRGAAESHTLPCPGRLLAAAQGVQRLPDLRPKVCGDRKSTRLNSSHVKISYA